MTLKSLALLCVSLASTAFVGAAQAANPMGFAYKYTTNTHLYAKPTAMVVAGRCNLYDPAFQKVRAGGGEVLMYLAPAARPDNWTCTHDWKFYMGNPGKVPLWRYPSYGQRIGHPGTHMTDLRPGSPWILWVVSYVEKIMREGKFDGVFLDAIGGQHWAGITNWNSWPLWEKNLWTDGSVDLVRRLDAKRRAINPNFIIVNNNIWDRKDRNTRGLVGERYVDGVGLEFPTLGVQLYHRNIVKRPFGNLGHRRVFVLTRSVDEARAWAKVPGVTHVSHAPQITYPTVPVVGFTALNDR